MSLTVTQANAVNIVADYVTGSHRNHNRQVRREEAVRALQLLVPGAYKTLAAGWTPQQIDEWARSEGIAAAPDRGSASVALVLAVCIAGALLFLAALGPAERGLCHVHHNQLAYCPGYSAGEGTSR